MDGPARATIERDLLLPYLRRQRWFGGKARDARTAHFTDWAVLDTGAALAIVRVTYADGTADLYHVPTTVLAGPHAAQVLADRPETVLARLPLDDLSLLCDAMMDDEACRTIFAATRREGTYACHSGDALRARPVAPAGDVSAEAGLAVVRFASTHSNSAAALGGRYLLKVFRRLETGLNPDIEIGRFLARHGRRIRVPSLVGSLEHVPRGGEPTSLVLTQALVPSQRNGWEYAVAEARHFFERGESAVPPSQAAPADQYGPFLGAAETLGRRTAELHLALASSPTDRDFAPTSASRDEVQTLARHVRNATDRTLDLLAALQSGFDPDVSPLAGQVLAARPAIIERIARLGHAIEPFMKIRVHGDYHLAQVLSVEDDFVIIDFEGEPTRPLAERRARQSPLRDVAGMLRSFSYAAHAALAEVVGDRGRRRALQRRAASWIDTMSSAFLRGYFSTAAGAAFVPADPDQVQALGELFLIDKAVYELDYEMNNRPDWIGIPLQGLLDVAAGSARWGPGLP